MVLPPMTGAQVLFSVVYGETYSGGSRLTERNSGGPCWGPYIEAEAESESTLTEFINTIEKLIESYRGGKVIEFKRVEVE